MVSSRDCFISTTETIVATKGLRVFFAYFIFPKKSYTTLGPSFFFWNVLAITRRGLHLFQKLLMIPEALDELSQIRMSKRVQERSKNQKNLTFCRRRPTLDDPIRKIMIFLLPQAHLVGTIQICFLLSFLFFIYAFLCLYLFMFSYPFILFIFSCF